VRPTSDKINIKSLTAAKEPPRIWDTEGATKMTKLSQSYLELRRALSLGSKSSSLVVLISREPLAFKVTFISTVTRFKVTDIYHGRDRSP
jgi:hypothetical protein